MKNDFVDEIMDSIPAFKEMLTTNYIAKKLNLCERTIRRYIEKGKLEALNFSENGRATYRVPKKAFRRFLETFYTMKDCI